MIYKPVFVTEAMRDDESFFRQFTGHMVEEYGNVLFMPAPLSAGEPSPATRDRVGEALGAERGPHPVRPSPAPSGERVRLECGHEVIRGVDAQPFRFLWYCGPCGNWLWEKGKNPE